MLLEGVLHRSVCRRVGALHLVRCLLEFFPSEGPRLIFSTVMVRWRTSVSVAFLGVVRCLLFSNTPEGCAAVQILSSENFRVGVVLDGLGSGRFYAGLLFHGALACCS